MRIFSFIIYVTLVISSVAHAESLPFETEFELPENVISKSTSEVSPLVAVLTSDRRISVYNYMKKETIASFVIPYEESRSVEYVLISPNGSFLAVVHFHSPHVVVYNTSDGSKVLDRSFYGVSDTAIVRFAPNEEFVAISDPFIVDGASLEVVNLVSGDSRKLGYARDSKEEGFDDVEFFFIKEKRYIVTQSYNWCRLSLWDMDDDFAETKIGNKCVEDIELADKEGNYLRGTHNKLDFFNIFSGEKVNTVVNLYEHPQSTTYGDFFSYGFSDSKIVFLGNGPDLRGTFLRATDFKTDKVHFIHDVSDQGFRRLDVITQSGVTYVALIGRNKISTVALEKL